MVRQWWDRQSEDTQIIIKFVPIVLLVVLAVIFGEGSTEGPFG